MLAQLQVKEGIDAVIVDSVLAIRKGLTDSENGYVANELGDNHDTQSVKNFAAATTVACLETTPDD